MLTVNDVKLIDTPQIIKDAVAEFNEEGIGFRDWHLVETPDARQWLVEVADETQNNHNVPEFVLQLRQAFGGDADSGEMKATVVALYDQVNQQAKAVWNEDHQHEHFVGPDAIVGRAHLAAGITALVDWINAGEL